MPDSLSEFDHVANLLCLQPGVSRSKMFGMPTLKVNGKAFAGLNGENMIFKLNPDALAQALALPEARPFEPMAGRKMKEWVALPPEQAGRWLEFSGAALQYVRTLAGKA